MIKDIIHIVNVVMEQFIIASLTKNFTAPQLMPRVETRGSQIDKYSKQTN